ncbi:MAG: winged helix-turn-helix transcriptional regulator [Rhodothermaceae bacterium]|nr:winged helix-turn-helix transcriptional regulator [Rhodothermaceae bacterium]
MPRTMSPMQNRPSHSSVLLNMDETVFGPFTFDRATGELFRDGQPVALPPKATQVLAALVASPGRVVSREELYDAAWNGTVVEFDQGLYTCIRQIRTQSWSRVAPLQF